MPLEGGGVIPPARPFPIRRAGMPQALKLRSTAQFDHVFGTRCSRSNAHLSVHAVGNGMGFTRLGLSVSKRVAGGGVMRNRIRRRLRDAFRRARPDLPAGFDLSVSARSAKLPKGAALDAMLVDLIGQVIRKAIQRIETVRPGPSVP